MEKIKKISKHTSPYIKKEKSYPVKQFQKSYTNYLALINSVCYTIINHYYFMISTCDA